MTRGGLGVRHAQSKRQQQASGYRLVGVQSGSRVAESDKYRRWHLGCRTGTILRNSTSSVTVQWDDDPDNWQHMTSEEARYFVDTNRWRIVPPETKSLMRTLTSGGAPDSILPSPQIEAMDRGETMTTKTYTSEQLAAMTLPQLRKIADLHFDPADTKGLRKQQYIDLLDAHYNPPAPIDDEIDDEVDDLDDEVDDTEADEADDELDDDEVEEPAKTTPPEPNGDTLTAKQVATRIGTDAKTLRKFFRAGVSDFKAVGQGGRYEFAKADLPAIKAAFDKWNAGKAVRTTRAKSDEPKKPTGRMATVVEEELDDEEPTLEDLDDLELDDDEELDDLELDD